MRASVSRLLRASPIPIVICFALAGFLRARGPFWLGTNSDPSYVYALQALRLVEGQPPTHLDHPGLTVQRFAQAAFWAGHELSGRTRPLVDDVLADTEWYLRIGAQALLLAQTGASVLLGCSVQRLTDRWLPSAVAQAGVLLSPSVLFELTDFKPEPVLYLLTTLLSASIAFLLSSRRPESARFPAAIGVLVGLAVATKLTALPLLVCAFVLFQGRRRLLALACAAATAVAFALPALSNWRLGASFVGRLATGPGLYGVAAVPAVLAYDSPWQRILVEEAPFFVVLLATAAVLVVVWLQDAAEMRRPRGRALAALFAISVLQPALVARHPYQPRYLVPALGLAGLLCVLSFEELRERTAGARLGWAAAVAAIALVGLATLQARRFSRRTRETRVATSSQLAARAHAVGSGCAILTYYRASSPAFALFVADEVAQGRFRARLRALHASEGFLTTPEGPPETFSGPAPLPVFSAERCVVLQGSPGGAAHAVGRPVARPFEGIPALSSARPVFASDWEAVFRQDVVR